MPQYILMYLVAIIVVLVVTYIWWQSLYKPVAGPNRTWVVAAGYENSGEAAALLDDLNQTCVDFMRWLRDKYRVDQPWLPATQPPHLKKIVEALLDNYNPDVIKEHRPFGSETSFTQQKGESMHLCLRDRSDPTNLVPRSTMLFVLLHEMSHIAAYYTWNHTPEFWAVFKFILGEAVEAGIYQPIDYGKSPVVYCGLTIDHSPLFDPAIANLKDPIQV